MAVGCSPKPKTAAPPPAAPAAAPATTPAATPPEATPAPEPTPAAAATPESPRPEPKVEAVRWSRADYGARERRLSALIANAETRDTTGETQYRASEGRAQRQRCTTKACIERSYAVEEAWMRKWEGSGDVK
ncbi:hypothetical protein [Phenylobacterium sp.]|uniref:hypothetical protein n=1 Tax=Phenylobacterium sp. TaxID=1871053 RepID=UPI003563E52B